MSKKVLIIDDDEEMCGEILNALEADGYAATAVHSGSDALEHFKTSRFDLVLLDLKIPGMNGFEVLRSVKKYGLAPNVIVVSGRPMIEGLRKCVNMQEEEDALKLADDVMNKPFDMSELLAKIKSLI